MASSQEIAFVIHPQNTKQASEGYISEFYTLLPSLKKNYLNAYRKKKEKKNPQLIPCPASNTLRVFYGK